MRSLKIIILSIVLTLAAQRPVYGTWYYSINFDYKTISAMVAGYTEQQLIEYLNQDELTKVFEHYTNAEIASAGIFASKWLDRKALKNAGNFTSVEKNYYYRRIYRMVTVQIMPRIWNIALLCIKHPDRAMYWGPYLYKVTEDVKHLCMQFEQIVCNGKITFSDCLFFCLSDNFKELFDIEYLGEVDFKALFTDFGNFITGLGDVDIAADIKRAKESGAGVAGSGLDYISKVWEDIIKTGTKVFNGDGDYKGKIEELMKLYDKYGEAYDRWRNASGLTSSVMAYLGTADSVGLLNLLNVDDYNVGRYINDYLSGFTGQYYKQRWYIGYKDAGTDTLCNYVPPMDDHSVMYSPDWYRYPASETPDEMLIYMNSCSHAGWTQEKVNDLNASGDGYQYYFTPTGRYSKYVVIGGTQYIAAAYGFRVTRSWNNSEIVYWDVFDSYDMDISVFRAKMEAKLAEYNTMQMDKEGKNYYIGQEEKIYYSESDAKRMHGCASVSFIKNCSGSSPLADGGFSWKENGSYTSSGINEQAREYAMRSTTGDVPSTAELDALIKDKEEAVARLTAEYNVLREEQAALLDSISHCSIERAAYFRGLYADVTVRLNQKQTELDNARNEYNDAVQGRQDLINDYLEEMDGPYRIPNAMHELERAFEIQWEEEGYWEGNTYIRHGRVPRLQNGECIFTAELSLSRKEKKLLGIRIHRAIFHVEYKLTGSYNDSHTVDVIELDPEWNDTYKNQVVNERLHELQKEYPDCNIELEYAYPAPPTADGDGDEIHLLWVSDRLRIAREIDYRLSLINARLMNTEKFMLQRENVLTYFRRSLFGGLPSGSKHKFGGQAFRRWQRAASGARQGIAPRDIDYSDIDTD